MVHSGWGIGFAPRMLRHKIHDAQTNINGVGFVVGGNHWVVIECLISSVVYHQATLLGHLETVEMEN